MDTDLFKEIFSQGVEKYNSILFSLINKYPQCTVNDIDGYFVHRCVQIQKMMHTFVSIATTSCDIHSAYAILRMLADHVASLKLIYSNDSKELIILRHMIFVIDGCTERIKLYEDLKRDSNCDDISKNKANQIIGQEYLAKKMCVDLIQGLELYGPNKSTIDKLIKEACWKFKDGFNGKYQWKDLYKEILDMPNDFISYLSQHVHGLAGSIGINDANTNYLLYGIALCLQLEFSKTITNYGNGKPCVCL